MNMHYSMMVVPPVLVLISGCAIAPLSEKAFGRQLPIAQNADGDHLAQIAFSADQKYETEKGMPREGDPVICGRAGVFRVNDENERKDKVSVKAGEEIAVTSVIQWSDRYFIKTCWPFVAFTPDSGSNYVVVNERIGGKGISFLWTGMAFQTCKVSVYRETPTGFQQIETYRSSISGCRSNAP